MVALCCVVCCPPVSLFRCVQWGRMVARAPFHLYVTFSLGLALVRSDRLRGLAVAPSGVLAVGWWPCVAHPQFGACEAGGSASSVTIPVVSERLSYLIRTSFL